MLLFDKKKLLLSSILLSFFISIAHAQFVSLSQEFDFNQQANQFHSNFQQQRRLSIPKLLNPFHAPPKALVLVEEPTPWEPPVLPWRRGIIASVFWIGEKVSDRNPTPNDKSAWDPNWKKNYGGEDHPAHRRGYFPANFTPKLNPFYVALPYNDLGPDGEPFPEAPDVIPWFWQTYRGSWTSVCKGHWVAIHFRGKVCYAQWEDCGPYNTDDWQYVFKGHRPKKHPNGNAGIEISPAVRDFLQIRSGYPVSWKFVDTIAVPEGPWKFPWKP